LDTKRHLLLIFGNCLILFYVPLSCRTSEKTAVSCPEFSINKNSVTVYHKRIMNKVLTSHFRRTTERQPVIVSGNNLCKNFVVFKNGSVQYDILFSAINSVPDLNETECLKGLITSANYPISPFGRNSMTSQLMKNINRQSNNFFINHSSGCDTIVLKLGSILIVKIEETGQTEIKYSECNNFNGPVISISKFDVSEIKYANGTHEILTSVIPSDFVLNNATINDYKAPVKKARFGIPWFVYGLAGLFVLSGLLVFGLPGLLFAIIALGLMGLVFKGISLIKRKRNPDKLNGERSETGHFIIELVVVAGVVLGIMFLIFYLMFILGTLI
jgi:hypothetical protein